MSVAPVVPIGITPPRRRNGVVHEVVRSMYQGDEAAQITVMGGQADIEDDTISLILGFGTVQATVELDPRAAIRIGQLLIRAGAEMLNGTRYCEATDCNELAAGDAPLCANHLTTETD